MCSKPTRSILSICLSSQFYDGFRAAYILSAFESGLNTSSGASSTCQTETESSDIGDEQFSSDVESDDE